MIRKSFFIFAAAVGFLAVAAMPERFVPRGSISDPTEHRVYADTQDTTILTGYRTGLSSGCDTCVYFGFTGDPVYRRVTYIRLFYFDTDGARVYLPGSEYIR